MNWHSLSTEQILTQLNVKSTHGLSDSEIVSNRLKHGPNELPQPKSKPDWQLFLEQFNDPIIYILIIAGIVNAFVAEPKDSIVIGVVVILNTFIGFIQERRAADAIKALQKMAAPTARVVRNGEHQHIPTNEVVYGDIVIMESGDRVPSDARLIDSHNLLVDESMLTGESFAINKDHEKLLPEVADLGDRINMVYSGTIIQKGRATGIVTAVGAGTEFGKISQKISETEASATPLQENIEKFAKKLSITILALVGFIFVVGLLRGFDIVAMLLTSIGLAVSAIPEGLPVSITITLSVGLYQMAKRNAVVKKLAAVETLGSTNIICSDKTGTLTKNQMTVNTIFAGGEDFDVSGSGYDMKGQIQKKNSDSKLIARNNEVLNKFAFIGHYCTESKIVEDGNEWKITGDATEAAVMIAAQKLEFGDLDWRINVDLPFESENQLMAVRATQNNKSYALVKGAPEKIIERCSNMLDSSANLTSLDSDTLHSKIGEYSDRGLRVLALAYKEIDDITFHIEDLTGLTLVGLSGIQDAVREEVKQAVAECIDAGVKVVMITGDHIQTARAVGKAVGLAPNKEKPDALKGADIEKMTDEELFDKVSNIEVFARVAPDHKYRIVEQLQKHGNIVAMTGDGVNDAPALRKADIGIAMGAGSDVAKEAAHMVLLDNNFISIVGAIRRGRVILTNLQHILLYILATSFGGILTLTVSVLFGFPLPVLPAQLLWINLVTDGTSTFPLAFEKEHGNPMHEKPRPKNAELISKPMIYRIVIAGLLMMIGTLTVFYISVPDVFALLGKLDPEQKMLLRKAQTMAFCTLAFFQIWNVQNSRSLKHSLFFGYKNRSGKLYESTGVISNPILLGVMCLAIFLQVSSTYFPFMNTVLDTVPLSPQEWGLVIGIPFSIIIIVELLKLFAIKTEAAS